MMRIIWWIFFGAKTQVIWLLEKLIGRFFIGFFPENSHITRELRTAMFCVLGVLWVISVIVLGFRTWNQVQFQYPILTVVGSIILFITTKVLGYWMDYV